MFGNLSKYLTENHNYRPITRGIYESVRNRDIEATLGAVRSFLKKRGIYVTPVVKPCDVDGVSSYTVIAWTADNKAVGFVWEQSNTTSLHSLLFTSNYDELWCNACNNLPVKWDVEVTLKGASIARSLQLVADVLKGKVAMTSAALNKAIRDAQIWESIDEEDIEILTEANDDEILANYEKRRHQLYNKIRNASRRGEDVSGLQAEYDALRAEIAEARVSVRQNVLMRIVEDPAITKMEARFEEEVRATPEERFGDMESYIEKVILGLRPSVLICGAPGVGKTYRIMQAIKKAGKMRGDDYGVIKGKCTPLILYKTLHDYQKKGQFVVIDDADDIITDPTSINLLKAATDSGEERVVSYGSNTKIFANEGDDLRFDDLMEDPKTGKLVYPREFATEGGVIIITNFNAGRVDTAIRNRALICDLSFSVNEVLGFVRSLSPHIQPDTLTPEVKEKALTYLEKMAAAGDKMEVSIRSFIIVAEEYLSDAPDAAIERRIREQMKWQAARGGKKY